MARGYSNNGEAVIFNFNPLIQSELQQAAQRRAENAALDRQVATDMSKLSADGIRPQDVPVFLKQYQTVKDLAIRNRDAIRNPSRNPQKYQEYQDAVGSLQATIAESKGAKEMNKTAYGFYSKNAGKIDQDQFRKAAADFNAPIGTPEFERGKNYDITQAIFKPEQFDQVKFQNFLNSAVKPADKVSATELPTGQQLVHTVRTMDPRALANVVGQAYDNDLQHSKKFFDDQFAKTDENQMAELQDYAKKYIPDFQIRDGKTFAIAANMYGQVEKDMGAVPRGSAYKANQAFQREQQNRSFAHSDAQFEKAQSVKPDKNYAVVNDIDKMLKSGRIDEALAPFEAATPGTQTVFLQKGRTPATSLKNLKALLKKGGVDAITKGLTEEDFKNGVVVTAVPQINPLTKLPMEVSDPKTGKKSLVYDYMAVPKNHKNITPRLGAMLNFSAGGKIKPLKEGFYKNFYNQAGQNTTTIPVLDYSPGSLDDEDDEDVPDDENDENL